MHGAQQLIMTRAQGQQSVLIGYLQSSVCYDDRMLRRYVFVGDYSGQITVLKLESSGVQFVNVLKGQNGSVQCLSWDGDIGWLFSGTIVRGFVEHLIGPRL